MRDFQLHSNYQPSGDQPRAIAELIDGINRGDKYQTLLGVTGSGKTFTMSNVIQAVKKPTLVISPNKTLAAQLFSEFKQFFPKNNVEFFISYYDYYQPEAYIPKRDLYIEKDFSVNDEIDRLRLRASSALVAEKRDVIIVASVSCIYGLGEKEEFKNMMFILKVGMQIERQKLLYKLSEMHYSRNDFDFLRGTFRVRGDVIDLIPAENVKEGIRIELFGDEIDKLSYFDVMSGEIIEKVEDVTIFPAKLFVTSENKLVKAMADIKEELIDRLKFLRSEGRYLEAERLEKRTLFDLEMMKEVGYCSGIENYSMHLAGRTFGEKPTTLMDYFPEDYLLIIDESHITVSQVNGMYEGDRSRKTNLVEFGFRLPSALENRPLKFTEFEKMHNQVVFVSATPADYELEKSEGVIVEQIIRPTGLLDPEISIRPIRNQVDDLVDEIRKRIPKNELVLVTTLTKRMSEDLTEYLQNLSIRVAYIHSDIDSLERVEIIRNFRLGQFDVLVGVNLLREGLDMPEVSLVAILDADKEGFLRSTRSLMQTAGRAARNVEGLVIMYADRITGSIQNVLSETKRRRELQMEYNRVNNITPKTIYKSKEDIIQSTSIADMYASRLEANARVEEKKLARSASKDLTKMTQKDRDKHAADLFEQMKQAAKNLEFELAAQLRDEIDKIKAISTELSSS
jgi:excinuclease ABC subunit B